jgi:hypothetical protein
MKLKGSKTQRNRFGPAQPNPAVLPDDGFFEFFAPAQSLTLSCDSLVAGCIALPDPGLNRDPGSQMALSYPIGRPEHAG